MANANDKYAVIRTGGKQYKVGEGAVLAVERLDGEASDKVVFDEVLLTAENGKVTVGSPTVAGATVEGEIVSQRRDAKKIHFRFKNKTRSGVTRGHRQYLTDVKITNVKVGAAKRGAARKASKASEASAAS